MPAPQEQIDTVSKACAFGDFDKLRSFVEADVGCVNVADESGYFPLQVGGAARQPAA
jgi:palmitoyltransferase